MVLNDSITEKYSKSSGVVPQATMSYPLYWETGQAPLFRILSAYCCQKDILEHKGVMLRNSFVISRLHFSVIAKS